MTDKATAVPAAGSAAAELRAAIESNMNLAFTLAEMRTWKKHLATFDSLLNLAALKAQPAPTEARSEDSARLDAVHDVLAERRRQVEKEGRTPEHDDMHDGGQMAVAAGFYALQCGYPHERTHWRRGEAPMYWPWAASWWKPTTKRANLVKAGALILAEIERIDRARASAETGGVKS
jgi:hypothetical protein